MMSQIKIQDEYIDEGLGFPVRLLNVPMIKVRGVWTPKINYNALSDIVLNLLALKPARLTGNEIKFIRLSFELTLEAFAQRFDVKHPAVIKWEKSADTPTQMQWSTEKDIRLMISKRFSQDRFLENYEKLETKPPRVEKQTLVDVQKQRELVPV